MATNHETKQQNMAEVAQASLNAVTMAQQAVEQARQMLEAAGISMDKEPSKESNKDTKSNRSSGGRIPSPEQSSIREQIAGMCKDNPGLFTIKSMVDKLGKDRIQVRNAINALEAAGTIQRFAEKLPEGRGARELIYKPAGFVVEI